VHAFICACMHTFLHTYKNYTYIQKISSNSLLRITIFFQNVAHEI